MLITGCATTGYAVRPAPNPLESADVLHIERTISAVQAKEFERQETYLIAPDEQLWGLNVHTTLLRLSRVTERPHLPYRAYLYHDRDPNAAALADGRVYVSSGMLDNLAQRGSREDELAFVLAHELAHTVAQHLVKRYQTLARQQLLMSLVSAGAAIAQTAGGVSPAAGQLAADVASLLNDLTVSGYSQDQELEADQLGVRYMRRAGYTPQAALGFLQDFTRFDTLWPFFRTHPYVATRLDSLRRYLGEVEWQERPAAATATPDATQARLRHLRRIQRQYPAGSVSWRNLERQIETLERASP